MVADFSDLYQEELTAKGKISLGFWLSSLSDLFASALNQHIELVKSDGLKNYLQQNWYFNRYNLVGLLLLSPSLVAFAIEFISRILQGDLTHYNRTTYALLSHTLFWQTPVLFTWIVIFPVLAVFINLLPLLQKRFSFRQQLITLVIITFGLGFLAVVKLHDFAPCFIHGLTRVGIGQIPQIISICQKA